MTQRPRRASGIRSRLALLAPVGFAIALAAVAIAPAQALWFQTLSGTASVSTGTFPPADPPVPADATATPSATPTTCHRDWHDHVRFDGDVSISGNGPLSAAIELTNNGTTAARGGLLGLATVDGWAYVSRVDFGNGQTWLVDGQRGSTLYSVGDIDAGDAARVSMTIEMTEAWHDAPPGSAVDLRIELAGQSCDDHGDDDANIHIDHNDGEDDEEASTPSPSATHEPSQTPVASSTSTATPIPTDTPSPTSTPSIATPSPTSTPTGEPGDRAPG